MIEITPNNFTEYALKTESVLTIPVGNTRKLHAVLGMSSELMELREALIEFDDFGNNNSTSENLDQEQLTRLRNKIILEAGDFLWFLAIELDNANVEFDKVLLQLRLSDKDKNRTSTTILNINDLVILSEQLISMYKSDTFYKGSSAPFETYLELYRVIIMNINALIEDRNLGVTLIDCLEPVIVKLNARYPGKIFNADDAVNRNVEQEFNAVEAIDKAAPPSTEDNQDKIQPPATSASTIFTTDTYQKLNALYDDGDEEFSNEMQKNIGPVIAVHILDLCMNETDVKVIQLIIGRILLCADLLLNNEKCSILHDVEFDNLNAFVAYVIDTKDVPPSELLMLSSQILKSFIIGDDLLPILHNVLNNINVTILNKYDDVTFESCLLAGIEELTGEDK